MADKVAVVTGANKGIGFATVRELCKRGVGVVYLTARDAKRGEEAVEKLKKEGYNPQFYLLEVTDRKNIKAFAEFLKRKHDGIDILINNAAVIKYTSNAADTTYEESKWLLDVNYYSLLTIQEYIYPILKDNSRVINISSDCGHISNLENQNWIQRLTKRDLKLEDVNAFVTWFLDCVKHGSLNEKHFVGSNILAYRVSKIALSALTRVQQKEIGRNISINCMHPGLVETDMTGFKGMFTVEKAAETPVYLALDVDQSVKGKYFWDDKSEQNWADHKLKLHVNRPDLLKYMEEINFFGK